MTRIHKTSLNELLSQFTLQDMERTLLAIEQGRAIRNRYDGGNGRGCLLFLLSNGQIRSRNDLRNYFRYDPTRFLAASVVVSAWDENAVLTNSCVSTALRRAINKRAKLNAAEQRTVDSVNRRLAVPS